jgi:hypothetical protein
MKLFIIILATAALTAVVQYFVVPHYQYSHDGLYWFRVNTWTGQVEVHQPNGGWEPF